MMRCWPAFEEGIESAGLTGRANGGRQTVDQTDAGALDQIQNLIADAHAEPRRTILSRKDAVGKTLQRESALGVVGRVDPALPAPFLKQKLLGQSLAPIGNLLSRVR
jgi:hypothetical protein